MTFEPVVHRGLLSAGEIDAIRGADLKFNSGTTGGYNGQPPQIVRDSLVSWLVRPDFGWLIDRLTPLATELTAAPLAPLERVQFGRYAEGGHYSWHQDAVNPSFSRYRQVSLSIIMQHAEQGGALEIKDHDPIELAPGDCVLFPSSMYHRVTPVEAGLRESLVAWFEKQRSFSVVDGLLTPEEREKALTAFTPDSLTPSLHGDKVIPGCTHRIQRIYPNNADWNWLFRKLVKVSEAFRPGVAMLPDWMMLAEYSKGEHYHWHPDSARGVWTEPRIVSMTVLLEDAEAGGAFEINGHGAVKMAPGDGLLFDSDMVHRVTPVAKGRRRSVVFWMKAI